MVQIDIHLKGDSSQTQEKMLALTCNRRNINMVTPFLPNRWPNIKKFNTPLKGFKTQLAFGAFVFCR